MDHQEVPSGWKLIGMGEACELRKEAINPIEYSNMSYVGLEHIDPGNPELKRIGNSSEVNSSKSRFYPGDILYGKLRPYLDKSVLVDFEGLCSTDILVLKSKESTIPQFLVDLIHTNQFLNYAISTSTGVNHPRTSWSSISALQFLLPPLPEQRAIARALRAVQGAREARLREVALERERKAALMEHLFTHGTRGEATKMTEIGEMPESWSVSNLQEIIVGVIVPTRDKPKQFGGPYPWITLPDLKNDSLIIFSSALSLTRQNADIVKNRLMPKDTVLLSCAGSLGKSVILGVPSYANQQFYGFVCRPDKLIPAYLCYKLKSFSERYSKGIAGTTTLPFFSKGVALSIKVPLPHLDEQTEVATVLQACDSKIAALENEARLHQELFRAMLEELMSGRLQAGALVEDAA